LQRLFATVSSARGATFVVVPHLDPARAIMVAEPSSRQPRCPWSNRPTGARSPSITWTWSRRTPWCGCAAGCWGSPRRTRAPGPPIRSTISSRRLQGTSAPRCGG